MAKKRAFKTQQYAVDAHGHRIDWSPARIQRTVDGLIANGRLLFVGSEVHLPDGSTNLGVQFFCPPSDDLATAFEAAAHAVRSLLAKQDVH